MKKISSTKKRKRGRETETYIGREGKQRKERERGERYYEREQRGKKGRKTERKRDTLLVHN